MTAPTVEVTAKLSSFGGPALAGVVITATADKDDNYQGLILRKTVTATTDTNGEAVFNLFPNALATAALPGLGTTGSTYRFTASVPNGWRMDVSAQVPNVACDLHSIVMADDAELPTPGEVAGAVRYDIAQTLTSPQQAQARANIGFDAAVRAVALTGLSLATATAVTAADSVLVAFGKAQAQITALDTAKANLSGAAFTGAVSATGFTGPLTGNVTGNVSGSAGSVAASAITGTTLAANVVTSSLTAVGTIATGVWQGTAIADTYLATISTGGKVANSATTATSANTASAIVARDASGNFTAGTITAALSGNASTATTLATARNINGVAFNGSADITVTAAAGTLTGTTLAANVVNASLNSITPTGGLLAVTGSFTASGNASFQANAIAQAGLRITGAAPLNANDGRLFAYEAPITKFYIGDGTGYSFAFGKRAGGVSTDLVTITDTGAVTINNNLTVAGVAVTGNVSATGSLQAGAVSATKLSVGDDATYDLNIKNAGSSGASAIGNLLAGNAGTSALFFSDTDANGKGRVQYEHATDTLKLFAGSAARFTQTDSLTTIDNPTSITSTLVVGQGSTGYSTPEPFAAVKNSAEPINAVVRNNSSSSSASAGIAVNAYGNSWRMAIGSTAKNSNRLTWEVDALGSPVEKMGLDTSGNLSVVGTVSTANALEVLNAKSAYFYNSGSTTFWGMRNNANVLECSYNGGGAVFQYVSNGSAYSATGTWGTISDARRKRDVTDATPKLYKLLAWRIVNYYLIDDPTNTKMLGWIAQELQKTSPGLVEEIPDYEFVEVEPARTDTVTHQRQAVVVVDTVREEVQVIDGQFRRVQVPCMVEVPQFTEHLLFDADGQPVMEVAEPAVEACDALFDKYGKQVRPAVMAKAAVLRQAIHRVPVMEDFDVTVEVPAKIESRPTGTVTLAVKQSVVLPMAIKAMQEMHSEFDARLKTLEGA